MKQMKKIDFKVVATDFNNRHKTMLSNTRLAAIHKGQYKNADIEQKLKKMIVDSNGNTKKKYLIVDYKMVAEEIYRVHSDVYDAGYLKQVHSGKYQSGKVLGWIEDVLK